MMRSVISLLVLAFLTAPSEAFSPSHTTRSIARLSLSTLHANKYLDNIPPNPYEEDEEEEKPKRENPAHLSNKVSLGPPTEIQQPFRRDVSQRPSYVSSFDRSSEIPPVDRGVHRDKHQRPSMIGYYDERKQPPPSRNRSTSRPTAPPRPAWPDTVHRDARGRPSRVPFEYTDNTTDQVQRKQDYKDPLAPDTSEDVEMPQDNDDDFRPSIPPQPTWPDDIHRDARKRPSRVPFQYTDTPDQEGMGQEYRNPLAETYEDVERQVADTIESNERILEEFIQNELKPLKDDVKKIMKNQEEILKLLRRSKK
jgi:hypothetical protein